MTKNKMESVHSQISSKLLINRSELLKVCVCFHCEMLWANFHSYKQEHLWHLVWNLLLKYANCGVNYGGFQNLKWKPLSLFVLELDLFFSSSLSLFLCTFMCLHVTIKATNVQNISFWVVFAFVGIGIVGNGLIWTMNVPQPVSLWVATF